LPSIGTTSDRLSRSTDGQAAAADLAGWSTMSLNLPRLYSVNSDELLGADHREEHPRLVGTVDST
jgi:hypothetical protein